MAHKKTPHPGGRGSSGPGGAATGAAADAGGAGVVSVLGAGAAVPFGVLNGVCCGVPLGVLDGALVVAGMGAVSTSFDRVRGRAPPPFSFMAELLLVVGATATPFVRISAVELDSPASPFTLIYMNDTLSYKIKNFFIY